MDFILLRLKENHVVNIMLVSQDLKKLVENTCICVYKERNPRWSQEIPPHSFLRVQPSWDITPHKLQEEIIENAQNDLAFDFKVFVYGTTTYFYGNPRV